ncbi:MULTISPECIES: sensor histidine kinase [Streptomyces]|uniref:histidine kinase n=1 Tax=Streptomyces solicathayae TaxID=3081768 RepID=A0ABZ0LN41_9ACTN|nr:ATP-binding protein [Streptomyces sp. HUAS YS2]WOX20922.1 ATP-binding protein [Streptomyces sp. HUAS YS2]
MSQLRAPAARPDRREGGRHGRPGARSTATGHPNPAQLGPEARLRPQLLRTSVLPAVAVALGGAAAVLFTLRSTGTSPSPGLWAALAGSAALAVAAVAAAVLGAERVARTVLGRAEALRRGAAQGQDELLTVVEQLRRGEGPSARPAVPRRTSGGDEFDQLAQELSRSHEAAVAAVVQASRLSSSVGNEQKVEVFVNLARRLQSLVHREIQLLDELENEVEDPELLKGLFHVDHLATRIRRHAENLAVLGGAISRRQWSNPVTMTEVLRSSIAEVEQYPRVKLVPPIDGTLRGHAVADVIHLLAELVENATLFSAPHTTVLLRAQHVTAGLAIEVEDRGLGMPVTEQNKMNALLADPDQVNVAHLLQDGRIGLFVVSALARRHGIAVRLQANIYGGVQAVLVLPQGLLGQDQDTAAASAPHTIAPQQPEPAAPHPAVTQSAAHTAPAAPADPYAAPQAPAPAQAQAPAPRHTTAGHRPLTYTTAAPGIPVQPMNGATPTDGAPAPYAAEPLATGPVTASPAPGPNAPLPVRGDRADRPTPAGGRPVVPPQSPRTEHTAVPQSHLPGPTPSGSPVRGTMGRPQLPKRRAQEHLVPQLRDEPAARPSEEHALHDPGLMAAFQRGIGLAESQPAPQHPHTPFEASRDPLAAPHDPLRHDDAHKE